MRCWSWLGWRSARDCACARGSHSFQPGRFGFFGVRGQTRHGWRQAAGAAALYARVPIWVGGAIRRSAVRAARLGDGWYGGVNFRLSQLPRQTQAYRAALGAGVGTVAINRVTLLARTPAEVDDLAQRHLGSTLESYARPGESLQQVSDDVALVGTPSKISAQLERYRTAGVTHVFARLSLDDTPPEVARGTIELLGREVIPRFAS